MQSFESMTVHDNVRRTPRTLHGKYLFTGDVQYNHNPKLT